MQLSNHIKITKVKDHSAAATTDVESDGVDMAGFEGVIFMTSFGTAAADNLANAQQSTDNSTFAALLGTAVAQGGASDEDVWIDIYRPLERYVSLHVDRGTSSTLESIWAIQYGARKLPVDNTTTGTIAGEAHVSPIEGTA